MTSEFELKKIHIETLGEYLYTVRQHFDYTLEEVANKTDIFEKFIQYLEEGKYHLLPPDVYVSGFLKKLADLYKISFDDLITQFKKERGIVEHNAREKMVAKKTWKEKLTNVSITPKLITISTSVLLGAIAFIYILAQVFSVNRTPSLIVIEPKSDTVLSGDSVSVKGTTEPGMSLKVNGQNVFVLPDGTFETVLSVAPGQKDITVVASNKFGKEKLENISLRVEEPQVAGARTDQPAELVLELEFTRETTITLNRDGVKLPEEVVPAFAIKRVVASDSVKVMTSDAGSTRVNLNGKSLGTLGKIGEQIEVEFGKQAQDFVVENNN